MAARSAKPSKEELAAARSLTLADVIANDLKVLFVGINPGLYSAAIGHNFGRPGNRFWPTLHASGFTPELLTPARERELLRYGLGITNVVARTTAKAEELTADELRTGAMLLADKVRRVRPRTVAVLGVTAYRTAFAQPKAGLGRQEARIGGATLWVLPNPSGLNAHHQLPELARLFRALRVFVDGSRAAAKH